MSAIVAAMVRMERSRLYASVFPSASPREHSAWIASTITAAGAAIVAASNAACRVMVVEGAPRTRAVRWWHVVTCGWVADKSDGAIVAFIDNAPTDDMSPCWDAANRMWVWGSAAHDPRPCAWPRPFARGADR